MLRLQSLQSPNSRAAAGEQPNRRLRSSTLQAPRPDRTGSQHLATPIAPPCAGPPGQRGGGARAARPLPGARPQLHRHGRNVSRRSLCCTSTDSHCCCSAAFITMGQRGACVASMMSLAQVPRAASGRDARNDGEDHRHLAGQEPRHQVQGAWDSCCLCALPVCVCVCVCVHLASTEWATACFMSGRPWWGDRWRVEADILLAAGAGLRRSSWRPRWRPLSLAGALSRPTGELC